MSVYASVLLPGLFAVMQATPPQAPPAPNPDIHYQLGPDSYPRDGVPKGEVRGPLTLSSEAYPGTQHTYWIYVPAQYDAKVAASLMIFNDGQAFKNMDGDLRAPNVLDNLIYRREIPVMIAVFINPGRRPDQPEPTPQNWGDRDTNRPTEYNTLDDRYARVIVDELLPVLYKDYNIAKDPERHGIGGASSGAIAAFTVAWERPNEFRKVLSIVGSFTNLRGGTPTPTSCRKSEKKPLRIYSAGRAQRQSRRRPRGQVRRDARLVPAERAADARADGQGLRPELHVGHRPARAEAGRRDHAGHAALAVARSSGVDRSAGQYRTRVQWTGGHPGGRADREPGDCRAAPARAWVERRPPSRRCARHW
jgi:enterochelin esterase family protein